MTSTELGYLSGVTSNIQTQLDGKANSIHNHEGGQLNPICMEFFPGSSTGHGGYIDFHFNNTGDDYTSRIIEDGEGITVYSGKFNVNSDIGNLISTNPTTGSVWFYNLCVDNNFGDTLPSPKGRGHIFFLKS